MDPASGSPENPFDSDRSRDSEASAGEEEDTHERCLYCQSGRGSALARCLDCERWFCNAPIRGSASHLIFHLLKRGHRAVQLHRNSLLGVELTLACFFCGNRNAFVLGVCPYMADQVVICCRKLFCSPAETAEVHDVDLERWEAVVKDKRISDYFLRAPESALALSVDLLAAFEKRLAKDGSAKLGDSLAQRPAPNERRHRVRLQWQEVGEYVACFSELIREELEESIQANERLRFSALRATVGKVSARHTELLLEIPLQEDFDVVELLGQELLLSARGESFTGVVKRVLNDQLLVEASPSFALGEAPLSLDVKFCLRTVSFERMMAGMAVFAGEQPPMHPSLVQILLGNVHELRAVEGFGCQAVATDFKNIPGLPSLNSSQIDACLKSCAQRFALLQGPPGTGKSVTCAAIVFHLVRWLRRRATPEGKFTKIIVCAPSNIVTDHLVGYIHSTGVRVLQVCSRLRESLAGREGVAHSLQEAIQAYVNANPSDFFSVLHRNKAESRLPDGEHKVYLRKLAQLEEKLLSACEVICTTCVGSADPRLRRYRYAHVLIDEATQAVEPECLLPLLKGAQSVVLVGDHKQLGPVVCCAEAASRGLRQSLFERMIKLGASPLRLQFQYRMHPELSVFSSDTFYDGSLQNGVSTLQRPPSATAFPWPQTTPLFLWQVAGEEELGSSGTSYLNRHEAVVVEKLIAEFLNAGVEIGRVAVITSYKGQRAFLRMHMLRSKALAAEAVTALEINSIDGFQGREKDFVIISTVRSSPQSGIGFLRDERRLNVALTRARFGMIVVGNALSLARNDVWNNFLAHLHARGLIFEGHELRGLKPSLLQFLPRAPVPRREEGGPLVAPAALFADSGLDDSHRVSEMGFAFHRD